MDSVKTTNAFPMQRSCPLNLPPEYAHLRAEEPVSRVRLAYDDTEIWIVTRYKEACEVLSDPRFSSDFARPGFPHRMTVQPPIPGTFIRLDPPDHTRLRMAVAGEFKPRRIEALRPAIQEIVDQLLDDMVRLTPPVDLVEAFALPLPSMVICELLGVPYADRDFFHQRVKVIGFQHKSRQRHREVRQELEVYLEHLVALRGENPSDDLLGQLARRHQEVGDLSREEVVGIATLLLIAGYETLANMIGLGTVALLEHPEQLAELLEEPAGLRNAIEELLRYQTVIMYGLRRAAIEDVEVGGQLIRAGEGVIVLLDSANRDEAVFEEPDRFDIHRQVDHHLAFGFGLHTCVGQMLARLELEIAWRALFARLPTLCLAVPFAEIPFRHDSFIYGVHRLPVTW